MSPGGWRKSKRRKVKKRWGGNQTRNTGGSIKKTVFTKIIIKSWSQVSLIHAAQHLSRYKMFLGLRTFASNGTLWSTWATWEKCGLLRKMATWWERNRSEGGYIKKTIPEQRRRCMTPVIHHLQCCPFIPSQRFNDFPKFSSCDHLTNCRSHRKSHPHDHNSDPTEGEHLRLPASQCSCSWLNPLWMTEALHGTHMMMMIYVG